MKKRNSYYNRTMNGFTLIELLIVIGLLGALAAIVLPKLAADRGSALTNVDEYNEGGTLRTLSMYNQLTGEYPSALHTGLTDVEASALATDTDGDGIRDTDGTYTMSGMPEGMSKVTTKITGAISGLTTMEATSLEAAGIELLAYSDGLTTTNTAADIAVLKPSANYASWKYGPSKVATTFDGVALKDIMDPDGDGTDEYSIVDLFITPTADWTPSNDGNSDWGEGHVTLGMDLPAQSALPTATVDGSDVTFAYYGAWFKVDLAGEEPAELVGITGTGGQPFNP